MMPWVAILLAALAPWTRLLVMATTFVPLPGVPTVPGGALAELALPPCTMMPEPPGKLLTLLVSIVALVMLATVVADPNAITRMPAPFEHVVGVAPHGTAPP